MVKIVATRNRRLLTIVCGVALSLVIASGAYSLTTRSSAGTPQSAKATQSLREQFTNRLRALGQANLAPAADSRFTTISASVDGVASSFSSYVNAAGEKCLMHQVPGGGRGYGCRNASTLFANGPLFAQWGSSQVPGSSASPGKWDSAWVFGLAASSVTSVVVQLSDCSTVAAPLSSDDSFYVAIGAGDLHAGIVPIRVTALNAGGVALKTLPINLGPVSPASGNIGQPPVVSTAC